MNREEARRIYKRVDTAMIAILCDVDLPEIVWLICHQALRKKLEELRRQIEQPETTKKELPLASGLCC